MNAVEAIKSNMDMADMICMGYLQDLSDEDLMSRPHPGCNHLKWQIGHLIASDHQMVTGVLPDAMPALPDGFADRYSKEAATSDDPGAFDSKEVLMQAYQEQHAAALAALATQSADDLDRESPEEMRGYAPTVGAVFNLLGSHWLMHAGQWVPVRRELGHAAMF